MLVRYIKAPDGKLIKQAEVYTQEEHGLTLDKIDPDALFITRKLRSAGYEAYIVGGAVRDLLIGRKPKDFDIVTDAHPRAIKKILPFSRIIGKRFRLVHVYFANNKIFEVATFRSNVEGENNVFGTLDEDAKRRDFTLNTLYYCPKDQYIIDQVGGVKDIRAKKLRNVIALDTIFDDDPVRMIRGVKHATTSGFTIPSDIKHQIKKKAPLLTKISPSRMTEEFYKILLCGVAEKTFDQLNKYGLLTHFMPVFSENFKPKFLKAKGFSIMKSLKHLDTEINNNKDINRADALIYIVGPYLEAQGWASRATTEDFELLIQEVKKLFFPISPSNAEIESALRNLFKSWKIHTPRKKRPRRKKTYGKLSEPPAST